MEHKRMNIKKFQCLNGAQLKLIAFFSMFLDHVNNVLLGPILEGKGFLLQGSNLLSILGRIAFPLFMFFLVEVFFKTRNRRKYLLNLFLFGVLSEVPFDLFTSKVFFNPNWNNMMFTLTLCLSCIWIIDSFKRKIPSRILWYGLSLVLVGIFSIMAMFLSLDYDFHAVIVAYLFYVFYHKPLWGAGLGFLSIIKEIYSFLGFGLCLTYNGKRGKQRKWLNYAFYPLHLLILGLLRLYFNI